MLTDKDISYLRIALCSDLITFIQFFYPRVNGGRKFELSNPICRESHFVTVARELTNAQEHEVQNLLLNLPVRHGKSEMLVNFVCWCYARYPDCMFIYSAVTKGLATKQLAKIRRLLKNPDYIELFPLSTINTRSKDTESYFVTKGGGEIFGVGTGGDIIGSGAGIKGVDRFSGALIIDDIHKASEVFSDTIREKDCEWYKLDAASRINDLNTTPIIFSGQRLFEDDLAGRLIKGWDGKKWKSVIIKGLDDNENALWEEYHPAKELIIQREKSPYFFFSQIQQNPVAAGGTLFNRNSFPVIEMMPDINFTFVTIDTAETEKTSNDASALSHWGNYNIPDSHLNAIHWLSCHEVRMKPTELQQRVISFMHECFEERSRLKINTPFIVAVESANVGVTLLDVLEKMPGITLVKIQRQKNTSDKENFYISGNKTKRFISCQSFIGNRRVTLPANGQHVEMCLAHMEKITDNNSHAHDDIADTCSDAVFIAFIQELTKLYTKKDETQLRPLNIRQPRIIQRTRR